MQIVCLDVEGVLLPEIWIEFSEKTGIEELRLTTRDISDYDVLMKKRLSILHEHGLGLREIQEVVDQIDPLPDAREFLDRLREEFQVILLSDTFYEFAMPLMRKLGSPTLFCHKLEVATNGAITNYLLRIEDPKRKAVQALHDLNFQVIASGDSYNDTSMLAEADAGILFCAPDNVVREFPQFPLAITYEELYAEISEAASAVALTQR